MALQLSVRRHNKIITLVDTLPPPFFSAFRVKGLFFFPETYIYTHTHLDIQLPSPRLCLSISLIKSKNKTKKKSKTSFISLRVDGLGFELVNSYVFFPFSFFFFLSCTNRSFYVVSVTAEPHTVKFHL